MKKSHVNALVTLLLTISQGAVWSQTWNSGSTGSDGALDLSSRPAGTVVNFGPAEMGFSVDHENVFHYTSIVIPAGVTLRMSARTFNAPVILLASDSVRISGHINLNGDNGHALTGPPMGYAHYPFPGSGGYTGGLGHIIRQFGGGPRGGQFGGSCGGHSNSEGCGGNLGANRYLVPLFGGSGGAASAGGTGGSAGGGAILIASSRYIQIQGQISAVGGVASHYGGNTGWGGGGSGGAIKLVAPVVTGNGTLNAGNSGGCCNGINGGNGIVRIEAFQYQFTGPITGEWYRGSPYNLFLDAYRRIPPRIRVTTVGGVPVAENPTGSFDIPDVVFNQSSAVTLQIEGRNIPPGTQAHIYIQSEDGPGLEVQSTPLEGSLVTTTASAVANIPSGYSKGFVRATWTP